ncbi:MAG: hypothetical protein ACTSQH_06965 [Candidatus Hodarchaeales archaeon]
MVKIKGVPGGTVKFSYHPSDLTDLSKYIDETLKNVVKNVNRAIHLYLEDDLKPYQQANHKWRNVTGTLRASHKVYQNRTADNKRFGYGWTIVANPYLDPQEGKIVLEDYAEVLEKDPRYSWFYQGHEDQKELLFDRVDNAVTKALKES